MDDAYGRDKTPPASRSKNRLGRTALLCIRTITEAVYVSGVVILTALT